MTATLHAIRGAALPPPPAPAETAWSEFDAARAAFERYPCDANADTMLARYRRFCRALGVEPERIPTLSAHLAARLAPRLQGA